MSSKKSVTRKRTGSGRRPARKTAGADSRTVVCRCEEVTEAEIRAAIRRGYHSLEEVKRVLRTGMGHCQGRGCQRLIARLIQEETGTPAAGQRFPTARPPLRPLALDLLGRSGRE